MSFNGLKAQNKGQTMDGFSFHLKETLTSHIINIFERLQGPFLAKYKDKF